MAATIFTCYFNFINIRAFKHGFELVRGDYYDPKAAGEVTHFQALSSALSATVGLGNIAGVATAITAGGADGASHTVTGTLDFHGVKKEIGFPATVTMAEGAATIAAEFVLNRQDFGISYPGRKDDLIKALLSVTGDSNAKWMTRTGATKALVSLGAKKADLEKIRKTLGDAPKGTDSHVAKELDKAIAATK